LWLEGVDMGGQGRMILYPHRVLEVGLKGIKAETQKRLDEVNIAHDPEAYRKTLFWRAVIMYSDAAIAFAHRYAEKARELAKRESDVQRKADLERIAEVCQWVPENPARTFHEALQTAWFAFLLAGLDDDADAFGLGRVDQFLYPYYKRDLEEGRLTQEEAQELLDLFWIKFNEAHKARPESLPPGKDSHGKIGKAGDPLFNHMTIGGITADRQDATNDLTYMILAAREHIFPLPYPNLSLRVHPQTPKRLLMRALQVTAKCGGLPQYCGDSGIIKSLLSRGISLEDARDYTAHGCSIFSAPGLYGRWHVTFPNITKPLELALNNGVDRLTGARIGLPTGDPTTFSFEDLFHAFTKQLDYMLELSSQEVAVTQKVMEEKFPLVFTSIFVPDCLEKGRDITAGGARYEWGNAMAGMGAITAGDSLAAIKKLVFDEKRVTMSELLEALDADFQGKEELHQLLLNAPKYGNDDDYADSIVKRVCDTFCREAQKYPTPKGKMEPEFHSVTLSVALGFHTAASPDGRRACKPLNHDMSPTAGCDRSGPSAMLKSASKIDQSATVTSSLLMTADPSIVSRERDLEKFASLLWTYFNVLDGTNVQLNFLSTETLRDAQLHPEKYPNLVVRVAGFNALFVELSKPVQDYIIERTCHSV